MKALDKENAFVMEANLRRVVEATRANWPDWGIRNYREKTGAIMDAGQAKYYDTAVSWLQDAREIYQQHNRLAEWQRYLNSVLETHHRKYKLVRALRRIH